MQSSPAVLHFPGRHPRKAQFVLEFQLRLFTVTLAATLVDGWNRNVRRARELTCELLLVPTAKTTPRPRAVRPCRFVVV
jgi:hypothetical protein